MTSTVMEKALCSHCPGTANLFLFLYRFDWVAHVFMDSSPTFGDGIVFSHAPPSLP